MSMPKADKRWAFPLGIIIFIFAVVGLVFSITFAVKGIVKLVDHSDEQKKQYQAMILPVVMNDIDEFDDVTKADMGQLIEASVWSLIKSDVSTDQYKMDGGKMLFPQKDVEKAFKKLFGTDVKIKHQTVSSTAFEFEYDSSVQAYKVPITGVDATYTPKVIDIDKKSKTVVLTVAYLSGSEWIQEKDGTLSEPEPSKYVKITLRKKDKSYYISAVQSTDAPEAVTTADKAKNK